MMVRRFDNDLVGTDAGDVAVQAELLLLQLALDSQHRELVRDHPDLPVRAVGRHAVRPQSENFRRGFALLSKTERANRNRRLLTFDNELARLASALVFCDDPGPFEGIPSEFRQFQILPDTIEV